MDHFFYGEDLFDDYTQWLVETIRAASANPRLQWVVKLHPSHVVKAKQANNSDKPAELKVIEQVFGTLPAHLKLVYPDTDISTYSLFEIADYAVTVRGLSESNRLFSGSQLSLQVRGVMLAVDLRSIQQRVRNTFISWQRWKPIPDFQQSS